MSTNRVIVEVDDDLIADLGLTEGSPRGLAAYVELVVAEAVRHTLGRPAHGRSRVLFYDVDAEYGARWRIWGTDTNGVYSEAPDTARDEF